MDRRLGKAIHALVIVALASQNRSGLPSVVGEKTERETPSRPRPITRIPPEEERCPPKVWLRFRAEKKYLKLVFAVL